MLNEVIKNCLIIVRFSPFYILRVGWQKKSWKCSLCYVVVKFATSKAIFKKIVPLFIKILIFKENNNATNATPQHNYILINLVVIRKLQHYDL